MCKNGIEMGTSVKSLNFQQYTTVSPAADKPTVKLAPCPLHFTSLDKLSYLLEVENYVT